MIDNIKKLWPQIDQKTDFILAVSKAVKRAPNTLKNHWFCNFFSVPEENQDLVVKMMQKQIKKQNDAIKEIEVNN